MFYKILFSFISYCLFLQGSLLSQPVKVSFSNGVLSVTLPEGIGLRQGVSGHEMFATKAFKAGDILYVNQWKIIKNEPANFLLKTSQGDFPLNSTTHSCYIGDGKRALYNFDSMMNHSCDATSYSYTNEEMFSDCQYAQIAAKDIQIGEEINCNYNLFEYDCKDKGIDECHCGSTNCQHQIGGFKWIPLHEQIKLLPRVDKFIMEAFLADHPEMIYIDQWTIPDPIEILLADDLDSMGSTIISKHAYQPGDVIYELTTLHFEENKNILFRLKNRFVLVNNVLHTVRRENSMREFYYGDSFMNHSCDPNTITFYTSHNHFETRALKPIAPGDELTCDYAVFDPDPDGEGFACRCGSPHCRGWVY